MAVYQKRRNFIDYCHKIQDLCRYEFDPRVFSKNLIEILKKINQIKESAKLEFSIYIIEKSD
ncbi:MAG: hypothetical protein ACFFEO_11420 [Candidatus Thorarchaeota archaeon]